MRLSELNTGEKGVIVKVLGHGGFRKRIVEMGFIKGKTVEVILNAPLKDPIKYRLLDYEISLRRQEAEMIEVVSEQEARTTQSPYHGSITEEITVPEAEMVALAKGKRRTINVALVGNPNCGKTSLFNIASGAHEHDAVSGTGRENDKSKEYSGQGIADRHHEGRTADGLALIQIATIDHQIAAADSQCKERLADSSYNHFTGNQ